MSKQKIEESNQEITNLIIEMLENGQANGKFEMPWNQTDGAPHNPITDRMYFGNYNALILMVHSMKWADTRWAGAGQWKKSGNLIKKGEKGTAIFFPRLNCSGCSKLVGFAKKCSGCGMEFKKSADKYCSGWGSSYVFNNQQTNNPLPAVKRDEINPEKSFEAAAAFIKNIGADVRDGGGRAFYRPSDDFIGMPNSNLFKDAAGYWATSLHEHVHWTGHESRLKRDGIVKFSGFGSESYAFEELVAELGAAFLCTHLGVKREGLIDNHAAYVGSWIKRLKSDPNAIRDASVQAGAAMRYLLDKGEGAGR